MPKIKCNITITNKVIFFICYYSHVVIIVFEISTVLCPLLLYILFIGLFKSNIAQASCSIKAPLSVVQWANAVIWWSQTVIIQCLSCTIFSTFESCHINVF